MMGELNVVIDITPETLTVSEWKVSMSRQQQLHRTNSNG